MQAERPDHMKDALAARRGKGLEIIIGMGRPNSGGGEGDMHGAPPMHKGEDEDVQNGRSDLAPPPVGDDDAEAPMQSAEGIHAPHPAGVIASQHEYAPGDVPTPDDARAHFSENMSEHDIKDMADRRPRSLAERARQEAFKRKKN